MIVEVYIVEPTWGTWVKEVGRLAQTRIMVALKVCALLPAQQKSVSSSRVVNVID